MITSRSWHVSWRRHVVAATCVALMVACQSNTSSRSTDTRSPTTPTATTVVSEPSSTAPEVTTTSSVVALDSAARIAAELTLAERGIRNDSLSEQEVDSWGRRQQRAYRALSNHPEWDDVVRGSLPPDVVAPFSLNVEARRATADHAAASPPPPPPDTVPAWTIVAPLPITELLADYREAESATGVPWQYLAAINVVESRTGRIAGASSSGALGPMQFLPTTWAECCTGNVLDAHDAIMGAAKYLAGRGAPGDMHKALFGYNPNEGYVGAVDAYARNIIADARAFNGYHAWEVYVGSSVGTIRLPVGYSATQPQSAAAYVAAHPQDLAPVHD